MALAPDVMRAAISATAGSELKEMIEVLRLGKLEARRAYNRSTYVVPVAALVARRAFYLLTTCIVDKGQLARCQ